MVLKTQSANVVLLCKAKEDSMWIFIGVLGQAGTWMPTSLTIFMFKQSDTEVSGYPVLNLLD